MQISEYDRIAEAAEQALRAFGAVRGLGMEATPLSPKALDELGPQLLCDLMEHLAASGVGVRPLLAWADTLYFRRRVGLLEAIDAGRAQHRCPRCGGESAQRLLPFESCRACRTPDDENCVPETHACPRCGRHTLNDLRLQWNEWCPTCRDVDLSES
ncbi:hypothetical protein AB0I28_31945 [Phytomonospora sp. NPDC050363]|uniref:hypothetical protein n=1 Tax=Phytomonospora sp. NPDC050363 TaxID=3155642 RepID=UPI003400DE9D